MAHNHAHHHDTPLKKNLNQAFYWGIGLNLAYVIIQVTVGLNIKSLSILSDAGHNFLDVGGLALSLLAIKLAAIKTKSQYSYGYKKASILISLLNAVLLLVSIGAIAYEALLRFAVPEPISGKMVAIIAVIGIVINGSSAFLFFKEKDTDINVKTAFLHLLSDALVSLGLVIGGIIIYFTNWFWIDPVLSLLICCIIIASTWSLLKDSLRLSLDGTPDNVDVEKIKQTALVLAGVNDFKHIHVWALSTSENALTGHLVVADTLDNTAIEGIKKELRHELEHQNVQHCTLEIVAESSKNSIELC